MVILKNRPVGGEWSAQQENDNDDDKQEANPAAADVERTTQNG